MIFSLPRTYLDTVTFRAMLHHGKEPFPQIWVDVKEGSDAAKAGKKFEPIAKAQLKKVTYIEVRLRPKYVLSDPGDETLVPRSDQGPEAC